MKTKTFPSPTTSPTWQTKVLKQITTTKQKMKKPESHSTQKQQKQAAKTMETQIGWNFLKGNQQVGRAFGIWKCFALKSFS